MVQNPAAGVAPNVVLECKKEGFWPFQTETHRTGHLYATGALFIYIDLYSASHVA